jgi:hypothetical protein
VEKYTTNKGKDGIIVDGYKYRLDKAFKNTNLWRCTQTNYGDVHRHIVGHVARPILQILWF